MDKATEEAEGGAAGPVMVRAVSRAFAILRAFTPDRPSLGLADVAQAAGLDRGTTRRMLLTLMNEGLVRQDERTGAYALSLGVLALAAGLSTGGLREEARPVMERLARETGVTVFLSVPDRAGALCLERVHGHDPVQVKWWAVGSHMPWNCGAAPRLLLAHARPTDAAAALRGARTLTSRSETDAAAILDGLDAVRRQGFALTVDDVVVGLAALAVGIRDAQGAVTAALSLGGLTHLILGEGGAPRDLDRLREAAEEISAHLR